MKKINNNIKCLYIIIICFLFIKFLSVINVIPMITNIIPVIWFIIFIVGIFITYKDYNHFYDIKDKVYTVVIFLIIYIIIHFSLGLIFGYSYNSYNNSTIVNILKNGYIYIIPLIFQEYIRGILCNYSSNSTKIKIIISVLFILINLSFYSIGSAFISGEFFLKFLCLNLIPLIAREFLITYLTSVGSYKVSLMYLIILTSYSIFIPIVPNLNFFISGIINTIFPVLVYLIIDKSYELEITKVYRDNSKKNILSYIPILTIVIILILNYFGIFKYQMVAILSNSMQPLYSKGDVILYQKLNEEDIKNLKVGDIIVYVDKKGNNIIHRIIKIQENESKQFITKGDANESADNEIVSRNNIKGKYIIHVKFLGYPKMIMYDLLNK